MRDGLLGKNGLSLRAYDEYFVDLNGRGSLRNMVTAGIGVTLGKSGIAEFYHAWSDERFTADARYWLLVTGVQAAIRRPPWIDTLRRNINSHVLSKGNLQHALRFPPAESIRKSRNS